MYILTNFVVFVAFTAFLCAFIGIAHYVVKTLKENDYIK